MPSFEQRHAEYAVFFGEKVSGRQAVPSSADFCEPERWPELDWEHLADAHAMQKGPFDRYVPPAAYRSFEAWRDASQQYQAAMRGADHCEPCRREMKIT